jgi:hypothetical protein
MHEVEREEADPNVDFFESLQKRFAAADAGLDRHFGSRAQIVAQVIEALRAAAVWPGKKAGT